MKTSCLTSNLLDTVSLDEIDKLNPTQVGNIGELSVAAYLTAIGLDVHHIPTKGFDLLVIPYGDESKGCKPIRVDVKTSLRAGNSIDFTINRDGFQSSSCDVLAFYCVELQQVKFVNSEVMDQKCRTSFTLSAFLAGNPKDSWEQAQKNPQLSFEFEGQT